MTYWGAVARLARATGHALVRFADDVQLLELGDQLDEVPVPAPTQVLGLGHRQQQVLDVLGNAGTHGMRTSAIATAVGIDHPNALLTLRSLETRGWPNSCRRSPRSTGG
jgi:hypothetical protein